MGAKNKISLYLAALSLTMWFILVAIFIPQARVLGERLSHDETLFLREDLDSYVGLRKLIESKITRAGELVARETVVVVFKPVSLDVARLVEEAVSEALVNFNNTIIGPYSVYQLVVDKALAELSLNIDIAVEKYQKLITAGYSARNSADMLALGLNKTYGLATVFLSLYNLAVERGHPNPGLYAYEQLSMVLPLDERILLEIFYEAFKNYESSYPLQEATRRAAIDLAMCLDPALARAMEYFDLSNYRDYGRILYYIYNTTADLRNAMSFEIFVTLVTSPEATAKNIVKEELVRVNVCLVEAFEDTLTGISSKLAVEKCRGYVSEELIRFPSGLPEDVRTAFISRDGEYAIVVGYMEVKLSTDEALRVDEVIRSRLKGVVEELYLYGTINLKTERLRAVEADASRVDVIVATSLLLIMVILVGTLSAPILIFIVTLVALTVAFGAISIVALHTDIYYLSRLFIIPLVFSISADYSIYYLFRVLEEREKGRSWRESVIEAWRRVAGALGVGGLTGVAGFSAFLLSGDKLLRSFGIALTITVASAFLASLTLTPSILLISREKLVAWPRKELRIPAKTLNVKLKKVASVAVKFKTSVVITTFIALAVGIYLVLSTPITQNIYLSLPPDSEFVKSGEILFTRFDISRFSTLIVVVEERGGLESAIKELESRGLVLRHNILAEEPLLVIELGIGEEPFGDGTRRVLGEVRSILKEHGVKCHVTGVSPLFLDTISDLVSTFYTKTVPIVLLLVALVVGIILISVIQPIRLVATAVLTLVYSIMATELVFSAYLKLPSFTKFDSLVYWVIPIVLWGFAISSGIDFEAFLTTRVMEEYRRVRDIDPAILEAVEKTGVVISTLAIIYIVAFTSLTVSAIPLLKMVGFAIAFFFLLDAFIIRLIVVPAFITTLGKLNWWPRKLD